ncbi:hypothetical protein FRC12_000299 [Ceratobasidium sp. 428]|nr:hypothetical protein FRC12_000299 [Ceratobasidium sp. 428]
MPSALAGKVAIGAGPCDPRCTKEGHRGIVSKRVRRKCERELNLAEQIQAAEARDNLATSSNKQTPSANPPRHPRVAKSPLVALSAAPAASDYSLGAIDDESDTTMPTWGEPSGDLRAGYEEGSGRADFSQRDGGDSENDPPIYTYEVDPEAGSTRPSTPDTGREDGLFEPSDTEPGYASSSVLGDETDMVRYAYLDDLETISPASSPLPPPPEAMDLGNDFDMQPPTPRSPRSSEAHTPDPDASGTQADSNSQPGSPNAPESTDGSQRMPDALRVFRELLLKHADNSNLTVKTAESFLDQDMLRCGPDKDPAHRLPLTLDKLRRIADEEAKIGSSIARTYAVCPNLKCSTLRKLSTMSLLRAHKCTKCGELLTRRRIIRRRGAHKTLYHYLPIRQYSTYSIAKQLLDILERPGMRKAMREYREHLRRSNKPPGDREDIQDGDIWEYLEKDGVKFFDDPNNIGLILNCDWFNPSSQQGAATYSVGLSRSVSPTCHLTCVTVRRIKS